MDTEFSCPSCYEETGGEEKTSDHGGDETVLRRQGLACIMGLSPVDKTLLIV